jgi:hypothetical protein
MAFKLTLRYTLGWIKPGMKLKVVLDKEDEFGFWLSGNPHSARGAYIHNRPGSMLWWDALGEGSET